MAVTCEDICSHNGDKVHFPYSTVNFMGCTISCLDRYDYVLSREYGSGHETVAVLLPGFAGNWWQNQVTRQPQFRDLTHNMCK